MGLGLIQLNYNTEQTESLQPAELTDVSLN